MLKRRIGSVSMEELIKRNKEELLRDKQELEKIEKRLDDKHVTTVK
ncbi:FbpB family small basic protein [Bacillus sinesaloumensis]|nr:FbpB family small basic protein [Bacillus sinesaloumensis]